ncbi:MAG: hypothetical protein IPN89_11530 [Saprospiraceae bacterium]|nr:hypothetical protein [Saprospiraceae bacterium]
MDIFNGNRKLEEAVMYSIDWGVFLRHNLDGPIAPFMYLFNGEERQTRVLMTDGDPIEYAKRVLAKEEKPFQQFVIGMEGYLRDDKNERVDSIIVQGFDKTQENGVALGQMFEPKEKNGTFKKIEKITFLGNPELPLEIENLDNPNYSVEEIGFNAMALKFSELTQYLAFFTHSNPSVIANTMKRFLRSKIMDSNADSLSGRFELQITPGMINHDDFLKFLVLNAVEEERKLPHGIEWEKRTGRKILLNVKHGDKDYLTEFANEKQEVKDKPKSEEPKKIEAKYSSFSVQELHQEFIRIISIPNARTNISALTDMTELMDEYEKRGIEMPNKKSETKQNEQKKPWWKFW